MATGLLQWRRKGVPPIHALRSLQSLLARTSITASFFPDWSAGNGTWTIRKQQPNQTIHHENRQTCSCRRRRFVSRSFLLPKRPSSCAGSDDFLEVILLISSARPLPVRGRAFLFFRDHAATHTILNRARSWVSIRPTGFPLPSITTMSSIRFCPRVRRTSTANASA